MTSSKSIKVAIDVSPLSDGNSVRGVGYYTKNLVQYLQNEIKKNPTYRNFKVDLISSPKTDLSGYDLIHYPYFDPFSLTLPRKNKLPRLITIHDLIPRQFKKHFPVGLKGELKWLIQKSRARSSTLIITVSHYSKYIISQLLKFPSDRIYVTHEAANTNFRPIKDKQLLLKIKNKYHLPEKFVLYVGDINWNKNVPSLVKACSKLDYPLVIAGSAAVKKVPLHPWTKDIIWIQRSRLSLKAQRLGKLQLLGFVPDEDLPSLYSLATIYCQPSYAEGFGLIVVEAMSCGTPVVYSQETSLSEVMDYNGEFFDPYRSGSLEKALKKVWNDPALQHHYSQAGLKRAATFSWKYTAIQTLAAYQQALVYGQR